ncbi:hypothetical protein ACK8HH_17005 [Gordonia sp. LUNF6]|uniref:hypothetical protein n=1 Tax=Gordonia sp. LUNF6 TaxID=3388658 RepID=UPI00399C3AA9
MIIVVPIEPILRGLDYVLPGAVPPAVQLSQVEQAMPLWLWGTLCLIAGLTALTGFLGRWRRLTVVGLWIGGSVYAALAVGQWIAVAHQPWLDGLRGPSIVTLLCLAQLGMAIGYAAQPDDREVEREAAE